MSKIKDSGDIYSLFQSNFCRVPSTRVAHGYMIIFIVSKVMFFFRFLGHFFFTVTYLKITALMENHFLKDDLQNHNL